MSPPDANSGDSEVRYSFSYRCEADNQPMLAIVEAMAWLKAVSPSDLEPLHHSIRVDKLNGLFGRSEPDTFYRSPDGLKSPNQTFTFEYEGCTVTVTADEIQIEPE